MRSMKRASPPGALGKTIVIRQKLRRTLRRSGATGLTLIATLAVGVTPAYASTAGGVALYISGPFVQGAEIQSTGTLTENFNSLPGTPTLGGIDCPTALAVGLLTVAPSAGNCKYRTPGIYGGASVTSSLPTHGGSGSNYFGTSDNSSVLTLTFGAPVKYVGFWWSGGDRNNSVTFLNGGTTVASLDTEDLEDLLGATPHTPPSPWPGAATVRSIGGTDYPKSYYFGNPRAYAAYPPSSAATALSQGDPGPDYGPYFEHRGYLYVYLNLFLTGDKAATSIKFNGSGFEFDNLTTSTLEQTPASSLVFVGGLVGKSVQFLPNANDATGSMVAQSGTTATNLSPNAFSRSGYVFTGWNTEINGSGTPFPAGEIYDFANVGTPTTRTLYAQWAVAPPSGSGGGSSGVLTTSNSAELAATGLTNIGSGLLGAGIVTLVGAATVAASVFARRKFHNRSSA